MTQPKSFFGGLYMIRRRGRIHIQNCRNQKHLSLFFECVVRMRSLPLFSRMTAFFVALNFVMALLPWRAFPAQKNACLVLDGFALPKALSLCGEPMPLENRCVWEMLDREFTIAVWDRAQVFMWLKRAGRYFPHIEKELAKAGMPEDLKYLAVAESSLLTYIRSSEGAIGSWQFMAHTARRNGLRKDGMIDERLSFEHSTEAALKHLRCLKDVLGTWTLALAGYNCGKARLEKEIEEQKIADYYRLNLPLETERFIFRIAAIKIIMENPKSYGYSLTQEQAYRPIECDTVPVKIEVPLHITDIAHAIGTDFKVLRELNPQILDYYLPAGQYTIKVPHGLASRMPGVLKQLTQTASRRMEKASHHYHVVRPGDTLSNIAGQRGVSVATLKRLNGIQGSLIMVGQMLRVSP
ncbi:MAG TPA: LysM peptidoglycan-binding domain-containing protein [Desulfobacterales bacterium]|nr:LysM peptidoglycan-binding domain-containing protein [Desulfobacterales bacterium]